MSVQPQDCVFMIAHNTWVCFVNGRCFGAWMSKGAAQAGMETEQRRAGKMRCPVDNRTCHNEECLKAGRCTSPSHTASAVMMCPAQIGECWDLECQATGLCKINKQVGKQVPSCTCPAVGVNLLCPVHNPKDNAINCTINGPGIGIDKIVDPWEESPINDEVRQKAEWRGRLAEDVLGTNFSMDTRRALLDAGLDQAQREGLFDAIWICEQLAIKGSEHGRKTAGIIAEALRELDRRNSDKRIKS